MAVDAAGRAYVSGQTTSTNFPTSNPFQASSGGGRDVFVTRFDAGGASLSYSTYLGGDADEGASLGLATDGDGNAFVAGFTTSANFPTTAGAFARQRNGSSGDGFVTRLNAAGSGLVYSTYLGGSASETILGLATDGSGSAYVTRVTTSADFPVTAGAFQAAKGDKSDAFAAKLDASGSSLVYATYVGGSERDEGYNVAVDPDGNGCLVGYTESLDFPTENALQPTIGGRYDGFVTQLDAAGSSVHHSTYLGGSDGDWVTQVTFDTAGAAYVAAYTLSDDLPTVGAFQSVRRGGVDVFVTKLVPDTPPSPPAAPAT